MGTELTQTDKRVYHEIEVEASSEKNDTHWRAVLSCLSFELFQQFKTGNIDDEKLGIRLLSRK